MVTWDVILESFNWPMGDPERNAEGTDPPRVYTPGGRDSESWTVPGEPLVVDVATRRRASSRR
jgi:hypothetical protein